MFKTTIVQRYLMREVFAAILLVLVAFLVLFSFFNFVDELRNVGRANYTAGRAALFVGLGLPVLIYELIPITTLIGCLYALSTLARHSEIAVLRASGVATRDLLMTLFRVAIVLAALTFVVGEVVVPFSERFAQELKGRALSKVLAQGGLESGYWFKDGRSFINIQKANPDATLEGVRIYRFSPDFALEAVTDARQARYVAPEQWSLEDATQTMLEGDLARVESHPQLLWQSAVSPELLATMTISPERMSLLGLFNITRHLAENKQKVERYEIAMWKKLVYPLTALVMVALALPFGYSHSRVGGVSLKIFSGVMLGILFYALNGMFSNLGVINGWPAFASATAPAALFLGTALLMLWWVERR